MNPFRLDDDKAYRQWRDHKLADRPASVEEITVPIFDAGSLTAGERDAILSRCRLANAAVYQINGGPVADKGALVALGQQFGLCHLDNNLRSDEDCITSLRVTPRGEHKEYIPYTSGRMNWHTDGYYNRLDQLVRSFIIHCVSSAQTGGENRFMDHEIAYILLRDEEPAYIAALMEPDVMTIPENIHQGAEIRPAQSGPVFSVHPVTGTLYMRYTARTRSIVWKQDSVTQEAVACLAGILSPGSPYVYEHRLQPGQGIISNNILHCRGSFTDDADTGRKRHLYRARYWDRIRGTEYSDMFQEVA